MATWGEFREEAPDLSAIGSERFGRHLMVWLATIRPDGGPRVHPVTPLLAQDRRLYVFMEPSSPKAHDLDVNPRYALHCHVPDIIGTAHGEFQVTGTATRVHDEPARDEAEACYVATWSAPRYVLFALDVDAASGTAGGGDPMWMRWKATPDGPAASA